MINHPSLAAVLVNDRRLRLGTERPRARRATVVIVDLTVRLASRRAG